MTNLPAYVSEEQLVSQLQAVLRSATAEPDWRTAEGKVIESRSLVEELALRIYNAPERWGLSHVPTDVRDDAAMEALTGLIFGAPEFRGRQNVIDWFSKTIEAKARRLSALSERQKSQRERVALAAAANPQADGEDEGEVGESGALFDLPDGGWARFEAEFPRDAFVLRLRHLLKRTPEQMAEMLEAPSVRAISMRLDRARDRFRIFCEQQGMSRGDLADLLSQLSEEPDH